MPDYDYDELYPNRFLKGAQFKGKPVTLTITDIAKEEFEDPKAKGGKAMKVVIAFKETSFQLLANKLNCTSLMLMFGRNTKDWRNKRVTLYPLKGEWFGKRHEAVRVLGSPDIRQDVKESMRFGRDTQTFHLRRVDIKKSPTIPEPEPNANAVTGEVPFSEEEQAAILATELAEAKG